MFSMAFLSSEFKTEFYFVLVCFDLFLYAFVPYMSLLLSHEIIKSMANHNFEPVHLRSRLLASGKKTLFLDICKDGVRSKEYLGLYLIPETDRAAKTTNKATMAVAQQLKAKRMVEIMEHGLHLEDTDKGKKDLIEWFKEQQKYYAEHGNTNYSRTLHNLVRHLGLFLNGKKIFIKDVTADFLRNFLEYLRGAETNKYGGHLSPSTIYTYFTVFSILMNKAVRLDMISVNPFHKLSPSEKPVRKTKKMEYLTLEEVQKLANTECEDWVVKYAFLFACFTGLRYIDLSRLKWGDIVKTDKDGLQVELVQKKTMEPVYIPISKNAEMWLPPKGINGNANKVFPFGDRSMVYVHLQKWGERAGIKKHMYFHMSRHTCATILLYYGADLYTVSKILGHTSIKSTQIYAAVVDDMKRNAVNNIPEISINKESK